MQNHRSKGYLKDTSESRHLKRPQKGDFISLVDLFEPQTTACQAFAELQASGSSLLELAD
jgi:hypothetical protein